MASFDDHALGPFPHAPAALTGTFTNFSLDGTTDASEKIFQVPEAITITHLGFRYGVRTGTPPTYRISLQGVSDGIPDGTIKGGASPASATFTPPADATWDGTWQWIALSNSYTTTRGEFLALVVDYSSGTIDGTNFSSFTQLVSGFTTLINFPYAINNAAGTRSRQPGNQPVYGYKSASRTYGCPVEDGGSLTAIASNTTPDEEAQRFVVAAGASDTFKVRGLHVFGQFGVAATLIVFTLYDGTTALQTVTWDQDNSAGVHNGSRLATIYFDEATLSTLICGSAYRIGIQPQETTNVCRPMYLQVDSNAELAAFPGGIEWYRSHRVDAGAWTDVTNQRLFLEPIIDDMSEPVEAACQLGVI